METLCVLVPFYDAEQELAAGYLDEVLAEARRVDGVEVRVIALDDASTDGTLDLLLDYSGRVDVLSHAENLDYGPSMNDLVSVGLRKYDPSGFLFLSQDGTIRATEIETLVSILEANRDVGVLQPLVRDGSGGVYSFGHRYNDYYMVHPIRRSRSIRYPWEDRSFVRRPSVSLVGTVLRTDVFERVGGLDERFEHYWESSDIGFRARLDGWTVAATNRATAHHDRYLSESTPEQLYYSYRNWPLFWAKYDGSIADRVLEDYWPGADVSPSEITEDVEEVSDTSFLERARTDAVEKISSFGDDLHFPLPDADDGRVVRH